MCSSTLFAPAAFRISNLGVAQKHLQFTDKSRGYSCPVSTSPTSIASRIVANPERYRFGFKVEAAAAWTALGLADAGLATTRYITGTVFGLYAVNVNDHAHADKVRLDDSRIRSLGYGRQQKEGEELTSSSVIW